MCLCAQGRLKWNAYITLVVLLAEIGSYWERWRFPHNAPSPTHWCLHTWVTHTWVYECSKLTHMKTHTHIHQNMKLYASVKWNIGVKNCAVMKACMYAPRRFHQDRDSYFSTPTEHLPGPLSKLMPDITTVVHHTTDAVGTLLVSLLEALLHCSSTIEREKSEVGNAWGGWIGHKPNLHSEVWGFCSGTDQESRVIFFYLSRVMGPNIVILIQNDLFLNLI